MDNENRDNEHSGVTDCAQGASVFLVGLVTESSGHIVDVVDVTDGKAVEVAWLTCLLCKKQYEQRGPAGWGRCNACFFAQFNAEIAMSAESETCQ